ncbi:hypothetical protein HY638_03545 [Candidatus Woesearchaeota archaeon]|nr:hypothetical protein [Candidatus Woesearchaeota archaeon]
MATTIAVRESTAQLLSRVKREMGVGSIDEAIVKLLHKAEKIPSSRFGSQPKLKKFVEGERARFHEL